MSAEYVRDAAATVAIFGFFASAWFGWAQERPPKAWQTPLAVASIGSVLLAVAGGILTWQYWSAGSVFDADSTARRFGVIVGIEFAAAGIGAAVLGLRRRQEFTSAWIALVVGVHFFPLASLLQYPILYLTAAGLTMVALAAIPVARSRRFAVSAVTGVGAGSVLLATALFSLATVVL